MRFALTGELLNDIPMDGQHPVFALDLALLAATLVLAGILLFLRTAVGAGDGSGGLPVRRPAPGQPDAGRVFQENAGVSGVKAFPLEGIVLTLGFVVASAVLLLTRGLGPEPAGLGTSDQLVPRQHRR